MRNSAWSARVPPLSALVGVALALGSAAQEARADVLPANVRPCEGAAPGAPCKTDRCNPGACGVLEGLGCPGSDPAACLACRTRDAGSCDEECVRKRVPCFVCKPTDLAKEIAESQSASSVYRYSDCQARKVGDACRTEACDEGRCVERPDEPSLACAVPEPASSHVKSILLATTLALVVAGASAALAHRRRARDLGKKSDPSS